MGKGYAEGPAAEEAERRLEELAAGSPGEVDPEELFAAGEAYGITVVRQAESAANGSYDADPRGRVPFSTSDDA